MTGKRQRETVVRLAERRAGVVERRNRLILLAERDLDQRELEHDLGLVRIKGQRVLVGRLRRAEPAAGEISVAKQSAEAGVGRRLGHRLLGERDRLGHLIRVERVEGAGRETQIADLAAEVGRPAGYRLRRRATGEHRCENRDRRSGTGSERLVHWSYPLDFAFSASPSRSGMRSSNWSSASV